MGILAELFTTGDVLLGAVERARYAKEDELARYAWDESKHPRDGGKFAEKEGGGAEPEPKAESAYDKAVRESANKRAESGRADTDMSDVEVEAFRQQIASVREGGHVHTALEELKHSGHAERVQANVAAVNRALSEADEILSKDDGELSDKKVKELWRQAKPLVVKSIPAFASHLESVEKPDDAEFVATASGLKQAAIAKAIPRIQKYLVQQYREAAKRWIVDGDQGDRDSLLPTATDIADWMSDNVPTKDRAKVDKAVIALCDRWGLPVESRHFHWDQGTPVDGESLDEAVSRQVNRLNESRKSAKSPFWAGIASGLTRYAKDEHGHEHSSENGQFVSQGGGSKKLKLTPERVHETIASRKAQDEKANRMRAAIEKRRAQLEEQHDAEEINDADYESSIEVLDHHEELLDSADHTDARQAEDEDQDAQHTAMSDALEKRMSQLEDQLENEEITQGDYDQSMKALEPHRKLVSLIEDAIFHRDHGMSREEHEADIERTKAAAAKETAASSEIETLRRSPDRATIQKAVSRGSYNTFMKAKEEGLDDDQAQERVKAYLDSVGWNDKYSKLVNAAIATDASPERSAAKVELFEVFKNHLPEFAASGTSKASEIAAKSLHAKKGKREQYQRQAFNRFLREMQRYGKDEKWITLNGGSGDGGNGGVPVKVDGKGNIVAGPAGIAKKLGESKKPEAPKEPEKEPPSRASSKDQLTENVARAAKDYEIDEDDLHDALEDVWEETRKRVSEREAAKEAIRKATGITAQDIARLDNNGLDYASDPKKVAEQFPALAGKLASLDVYASEHASSYPELELGDDSEDQVANIIDRIREGKQSPPPKHDADLIDEAAQLVHSARVWRMNNPVHDDAEAIPFGKQGQVIRYALKRWYMKDANGMEHAADGKFGSGGGKARSLFDDHEPTPEKKKATGEFHDGDKRVQKKLLSGLDSAPGQKDLFDVDGVAEKPKARSESDARNSANDWLKSEERKNLNMTAGGTHVAKIDKEKLKPWHDAVRSRYDQQISQATPLSSGMNVPQYRGHFKVGDIAVSKDKTRVGQVVELKNQTGGGAWGTSKLHTQKSVGVQWFDTREKEEIHPDGGIIPVGVAYERAP